MQTGGGQPGINMLRQLLIGGLLLAWAGSVCAAEQPDGFIYFVNYTGRGAVLTVDSDRLPEMPFKKVVGYPVRHGDHSLRVTAGAQSAVIAKNLQNDAVAQDGKGRNYWCFVGASKRDGSLAVLALEVPACAGLISAVSQDNPAPQGSAP